MSVKNRLDDMIININNCLSKIPKSQSVNWSHVSEIVSITSVCANELRLTKSFTVPFGRYLIFEDEFFNVQLDVFSENYVGAPHNHDTWGVMSCISGELGISDYVMSESELTLIRKGLLKSGSSIGFLKESDWHSTETFSGQQVASFHVYGHDFNLENGHRYDPFRGIERYERGVLHDYSANSGILELEV